jgi:hypothetical protein
MKEIIKTVFIITGNGKDQETGTMEKAKEIKEFLEDYFPGISFTIEERQKITYEIEKGDKVYWLKNDKPDTTRIDIITDVVKNTWGDRQYLTKELNGNRIGSAYESYLTLVM